MQTHTETDRVTSSNELKNEMAERLHFETLLTDIAARFVNLPIERIDAAIIESQRRLCDFLGVDRCVLWQFEAEKTSAVLPSHIHIAADSFLPEPPVDFADTFPRVFERMLKG